MTRRVLLSKELERVVDDYERGEDIHEPLELCVDLAESMERELVAHRLGEVGKAARGVIENQAEEILRTFVIEEGGCVIHANFRGKEYDNE